MDVILLGLVPMARSADLDEMVGPELGTRLAGELGAALRRRPVREASLAGLLHVLGGRCERLREASAAALDVMVRRNTTSRPLFAALLRLLVEVDDARVAEPLSRALGLEDGGGLSTIAASALSNADALSEGLAHLANSRSSHIAFAAELARVARGESDGEMLTTIAPRIKESHRIELSEQVLLPLVRQHRTVEGACPALDILRDSERHLGRWLCIAELTQISKQSSALTEARRFAAEGPATARAAWNLVTWALCPADGCSTKPNLELVARLSDRPSAEREISFLFRIAHAGQSVARPMLENLTRAGSLDNGNAIRAAAELVRNHGRTEFIKRLCETVNSPKLESVRGLALAALSDCERNALSACTVELGKSRNHASAGFATLVKLATLTHDRSQIVTEANYRRLQLGWLD